MARNFSSQNSWFILSASLNWHSCQNIHIICDYLLNGQCQFMWSCVSSSEVASPSHS